ncbi:hypothetical protein BaRGS_00028440, partial [Batillaria attramentaria]
AAKDLCDENKAQGKDPPLLYTVDCTAASDWPDVVKALCSAFSLDEMFTYEHTLPVAIKERARDVGRGGILLLLLRLHALDPQGHLVDRLARFLNTLLESDVTTIVTSRRRLQLPCVIEVKPLTQKEALQLLSRHVTNFKAEDYDDIVKHCHGLPPLVMQVARYVSGDPMLAYTPSELKQLLKEDPTFLMRDLGKEAEHVFSGLSHEVQGHVTTLAQLLDGTFSVDVLQAALGLEGARAKTVLRRLHDESSVVIDTASRRVRVQPLLVHHVRQLGHVSADDQARLRVVTLLGRVLVNAERELYLKDQDTVYGYVQGEWPQLQHVLRQAIHCTGDTFHAFRKVAFEAEKLLVRCFPEEATEFFRKMAAAAVRFGTPRDQAALQGLIGMAITQSRAMTGWKEAMDCFDRALPVMRQDRKSLVLPRLLCSIGSAYFRLSRHQEAEKYLKEALKTCSVTQAEVEQVNFLLIQVRSLLALPLIFRGQFTKVKPLLLETLDLCDAQPYKEHPHKPVLINSLGLVYERSGESQEKALGYYLKSLSERRRYMKVVPRDLVPPLNNIGMQFCKRGFYKQALQYLEEAASIMGEATHFSTALTQHHLGQLCKKHCVSYNLRTICLQRLRTYIGDKSSRLAEHQRILEEAAALDPEPTDDQKEALTSLVIDECQMCGALECSADVRDLWAAVERETEKLWKVRDILQQSDIVKDLLDSDEDELGEGIERVTFDEPRAGNDDGGGAGPFSSAGDTVERPREAAVCTRENQQTLQLPPTSQERLSVSQETRLAQNTQVLPDQVRGAPDDSGTVRGKERAPFAGYLDREIELTNPAVAKESDSENRHSRRDEQRHLSTPRLFTTQESSTSSATQTEEWVHRQHPTEPSRTTLHHSMSSPVGTSGHPGPDGGHPQRSPSPELQRQHSLGSGLPPYAQEPSQSDASFIHCFHNQPVYNFHIYKFQGSVDLASSYSLASSRSYDDSSQSDVDVGDAGAPPGALPGSRAERTPETKDKTDL